MHSLSLFAHQKCVRTKCKCICPSFRKMITLCPAKSRERPTDRIAPDYIYALSVLQVSHLTRSSLSVSLSFNFFWPSRLLFTSDSCYKHIVSVCVVYVVYIYKLKLIYYLFGSTCASSISLCKVYSCVLASFCSFLIPPQTLS
jgi:hypothetical protein